MDPWEGPLRRPRTAEGGRRGAVCTPACGAASELGRRLSRHVLNGYMGIEARKTRIGGRNSMDDHTPDAIGVDISKAHLDVHRRSTGQSARFANGAAGFEELAAWIGYPAARLVYEATGHSRRGLEEHLASRQLLAR